MFLRVYAWVLGFAFLIDIVFWAGVAVFIKKKLKRGKS